MSDPISASIRDAEAMGVRIHGDSSKSDLCQGCGHPWAEHLLFATSRPPTEGWIGCPIEGCKCHRTWSMPPEDSAKLKQLHEYDE